MAFETRVSVMINFVTRDPTVSQPTIQQLIDQHLEEFKEALVDHVTAQFRDQGQLLEETNRDLAVYKKALCNAERDMRDLAERFEQEKQALNDEIRQLREYVMHGREERFEQEKQTLNDGILQLKAIMTREKRAIYQQNPPPAPTDAQQHAMVREGAPTA